MLIGAPGHFSGSGAAYAFVLSDGAWNQQQESDPSDPNAGSFGDSVSISGTTAFIGAPQSFSDGVTGSAYVFKLSEGTWSQQQELIHSNGVDGDQFGSAVSVSGAFAFVGAPTRNGSQGSVFAVELIDGTWTIQQELTVTDTDGNGLFGASVAVIGGAAIAGASNHTVGSNTGQGAVYAFKLPPASLSISATNTTPTFQAGPGAITLTVFNAGGPTSASATVSDTINPAFTIDSVSPGCSIGGRVVTCAIASGTPDASTAFNVYLTASNTASASISNSATLTDSGDSITTSSASDTIAVTSEAPQVDSSLSQLVLSGSTDNGTCASGSRTLTATEQLKNTSGSTLTNPYAVISSLSGGNKQLSESADPASVVAGANVTFTFHIQLATCNTFQLGFHARSN